MNSVKMRVSLLAFALAFISGTAMARQDTLNEVVVTATRQPMEVRLLPQTVHVVHRMELTADYRQSVLPTLTEQIPGLFTTQRGIIGYGVSTGGTGAVKLRGIGGMARSLVLIDGLPQYAGLYGHPIADVLQTMTAERVEVVLGPASTLYGSNAMGGVVNIVTRRQQANGQHTDINLQAGSFGTFQAAASNTWRKNKWWGAAGAEYNRTQGHRPHSEFEQAGGFFKLGCDFNKHWNLDVQVNVNYFESSNPGTDVKPLLENDMKITRGMANLSITNSYDRATGAVRVNHNWGHHHINDGYGMGATPRTSLYLHDDRITMLSAYETLRLWQGNHLTLGFDGSWFGGNAWNRVLATGQHNTIKDTTAYELAGYVDMQQRITSRMTANAAVRYTKNEHVGAEWTPRGGLTFLLPHQLTLKATVGQGFRNPTIRELFMFPSQNPDLKPERLMNYELALRQDLLDSRFSWGVNLFYLKADNLIATVRVEGRPRNVNTGRTEHYGMEAHAGYRLRNLTLSGNYSYLHMSQAQESTPKHKAYVGAEWRYGNLRLGGGLQYVGKLVLTQGDANDTDSYTLLHLTASYQVAKPVTLFVKGDNLLAQRYQTVKGYYMPRATVMAGVHVNL
ncbi:MAG: TonB-dependent receptor [Bacteroidaceae bacterium]|nr:TonB-dependent receptor [Prevotellaceae bacterium]MDY5631549.1 TonB-dependent receptor [Bacteroidaceae bacterium]